MTGLGRRLRARRLELDLTQEEAEERSGVPQTTISGLETGRVTRTSHETIVRLADAYGLLRRELYEAAEMIEPRDAVAYAGVARSQPEDARTLALAEIGRQVVRLVQQAPTNLREVAALHGLREAVPVVNSIAADRARSGVTQIEEVIMVPAELLRGASRPQAFLVAGDCLGLRGIVIGDYLIVDADNTSPRNGQIVAARYNGEETAKIFHRVNATTVELRPSGGPYPVLVAIEGRDTLDIIGVYVAVWAVGDRG